MKSVVCSAPIKIVALASGKGSNLQAILDCCEQREIDAQVVAVFSDVAGARALRRAKAKGVPAICLSAKGFASREAYDEELRRQIDGFNPDLIVLAGFMRILGERFVKRWPFRIMNVHPSLLPAHKGLHTHQRVLDKGEKLHGATVHFVTPELDDGPIIVQAEVVVDGDDNALDLQRKVHQREYQIYPLAIQWFAQGRLSVKGQSVLLDGRRSTQQHLGAYDTVAGG